MKLQAFLLVQLKQNIWYLILQILCPVVLSVLVCFLAKTQIGIKQFNPLSLHSLDAQLPNQLRQHLWCYSEQQEDVLCDKLMKKLMPQQISSYKSLEEFINCTQAINMNSKINNKLSNFSDMMENIKDNLNFSFNQTKFNQFLQTTYKDKITKQCDNISNTSISFGIYFNNTDEQINYTVYYNRQMIEEYHQNNFDKFQSNFLMYRQQSMSIYGFILQQHIESLFTNKTIKLGALANQDTFSLNYSNNNYQLSYVFPSAAAAIVFQIIISNVRGQFYRMLRKFGEPFWTFWLIMYGFGLFILTVTIFFQMLVAKAFGVEPFKTYSVGASLLYGFLSSIPSTVICCVIGICIETQMMQMIIAVGFSVGFTLFPMLIQVTDSGETKEYSSLWDKYWCPQAVVWIGVILFPPFTYYAIGDHWATTKFLLLDNIPNAKYTIQELFDSKLFDIPVQSSKINSGTFTIPNTGSIVVVIVLQFLVYGSLGIYIANILPQSDYIGMPPFFFTDKKYWETRKQAKKQLQTGVLDIKNITKSYRQTICSKHRNLVLDKISFSIEPGTVVGLMGLTGSGKTTLCRILQGHIAVDSGEAMFSGINLTDKYTQLYHNLVTSCPQDKSNIMFNASIKDNIKVCKAYVDWNSTEISLDDYINLLLKRLKLEKHQNKTYYQLSGGMQRRLSLLISLMRPAQIYLADEVTANVDPQLKHDIWTTLQEYQKLFKRIIVMTSHDSYELQYICGQIVHLDNKQILLNVNTNQFVKENITNTHKLQINEIIYHDVLENITQSQSNLLTTEDELTNQEIEHLLDKKPQRHNINVMLFALRKRWYWFLNTWMATPVSMVVLAFILSSVFVYMTKFSSTANLNIKDDNDIAREQLYYLPQIFKKYKINSQDTFQNYLLADSALTKYISNNSGVELTMQTLKDTFLMDQLQGIQMNFGSGSRLLGVERIPEQQYFYLVDPESELSNLSPEEQYQQFTKETITCSSCDYYVSSVHCKCSTPINETANVVCKNFPTCTFAPTFYYFNSLNSALKYREKYALTQQQEDKITLSNNLSQPLGILVPDENQLYVNMPQIQLKYIYVKNNHSFQLVSRIYYGNTPALPLQPQVNVKNRAFLTNYNNDAFTKLSTLYLNKRIISNFYQQPQFNDFHHTDYYTKSYGGELMFSYFLTLEECLFILLTIVSFQRDSFSLLRKQLEGIGVFQWKLIICQIVVDALQLLFYTLVIVSSMVMIDQAPQFRDATIFIAIILEAICHSMILQLYMMLLQELPAIVLFLSILLTFQIFTTAFINVDMGYSLLLNLFLPGYYYVYILKIIATALSYPWYWLFYGILVNLGELMIALIIIYYLGRKNSKQTSNNQYLLQAEHISAGYGRNQILKDINMTLSSGQSLALIGNNGCGKTTFLKICIHQLKYKGFLNVVSDLAIIPQDDIVFHNITVEQYFKIVGAFNLKLLQELGLDDSLKKKYHELSSGQQRRLTIALVLSLHPTVVILDEITVGSDFIIKNRIWQHLNSCVETKIVISHDMDEIIKHSNSICFIKNGVGSMIQKVDEAFLIVVYQEEPYLPNFKQFFDKQIIQVDKESFNQLVKQLEEMKLTFTYEENSLEKLFVEEYKLVMPVSVKESQLE